MNHRGAPDILLSPNQHRTPMLRYALICLVIALVAAVLGASGVASFAMTAAYILGAIGLVLLVIHFISGSTSRV